MLRNMAAVCLSAAHSTHLLLFHYLSFITLFPFLIPGVHNRTGSDIWTEASRRLCSG